MDLGVLLQSGTSLLLALFFVYVVLVFSGIDEFEGAEGLQSERHWQVSNRGFLLRLFGPLISILAAFLEPLPIPGREKLRRKLVRAGSPGGLSVDEYHAARIVGVIVLAAAGSYMDFEVDSAPVIAMTLGALGFVYPDIWLSGAIAGRRRRIFRDLPDMLDTLRLAVDAGMDLGSAMGVVVEQGRRGPLIDELEKVERDMKLGLTRKDAFDRFAERVDMTEISSFVLALMQADQLGAPVGPVLRAQAEVSRNRRWQLAEEFVNKLPMKMLAPLVTLIFPASFIILFTPLLIQWMQTD